MEGGSQLCLDKLSPNLRSTLADSKSAGVLTNAGFSTAATQALILQVQ